MIQDIPNQPPINDDQYPRSSLLPKVSQGACRAAAAPVDDNLSGKDGVDFLAIASQYKCSMDISVVTLLLASLL